MTIDSNLTVLNLDERRIAIESFGKMITEGLTSHFESLLRKYSMFGTIDITEWTIPAIRTLLLVCRGKEQTIHLKYKDRYIATANYPRGNISNQFVEMIMGGNH
ncbi:MAG: hypothetical protein EAX81_03090 [Candidatus Thorarchaeota archaeon]|nr:hypothetical protein [Candidatus Thorarchaeota archaeon]